MQKKLLIIKMLQKGYRVKDIESGEVFTIMTRGSIKISMLHTVLFDVDKEWTFNKHKYASGKIIKYEFIPSNIKTGKIIIQSDGIWDPFESFGDEAPDLFPEYIQEGYRESFVIDDYTGYGFYKQDEDPVFDAVELTNAGDFNGAYNKLTKLWEDYPECIDALVHLGNYYFDSKLFANSTYNLYKAAVDIIERNLKSNFDGIFLWDFFDNRPYLRALHGLCLVLWKNKDFDESYKIAERLLRICPPDNIGIRFIIDRIKNREEWKAD